MTDDVRPPSPPGCVTPGDSDRLARVCAARDALLAAAPLGRRRFLALGGGALAAAILAACDSQGPRSMVPLLRLAERRNEEIERWLTRHATMNHGSPGAALAGAAFPRYFVSPTVPVWNEGARGPWRLEVSGLVERPTTLSLDDLVRLPGVEQRVDHFCVEGWTAVARWRGVRLRDLAALVGARPEARYVDFQSFDDDYHESWDVESATHRQTLIAYALDGRYLSPGHGAPARLHSPIKLGYKNVKYLTRVVFMARRNGGYWSDQGYEWYAGT